MKITRSTKFQPIHFSLLLACGIATGVHAQALVTDQSLQPPPLTGGSYHYDSALVNLLPGTGQEFTPSLPGLDFVDVNLHNSSAAATGMFEIAIHAGNIAAPVLELSDPVFRSEGYPQSNTHFTFPSTVPLIAGEIYALEIIRLAGDPGWAFEIPTSAVVGGQTIDMNYPGGRLILGGVPQDNKDMIFREGMMVPEPGVTALGVLGILAFGFSRKSGSKSIRSDRFSQPPPRRQLSDL